MKTAAVFVFLWVVPLAFSQETTIAQLAPATAGHATTQPTGTARASQAETPVPTKAQQQASKPSVKVDPEKEAAIRKLFEIQGTRKSMEQVIAAMSANMKPTLAKMLPPGEYQDRLLSLFFERFQSKLKIDDLLDLTIPIYDKYLSKEDIDGLAQFYQTPLGKKMISALPQVLIESQTAAMNLGEQIGRQSMLEVLAEHPDLEKAMEEAGARKN